MVGHKEGRSDICHANAQLLLKRVRVSTIAVWVNPIFSTTDLNWICVFYFRISILTLNKKAFIPSSKHSFIPAFIHSFIRAFSLLVSDIHSCIQFVRQTFIHSFFHAFSQFVRNSFIHSFMHSVSSPDIYSFINSCIQLVRQTFIHSYI